MDKPEKDQCTAPSIPSSGPKGTRELSALDGSTFAPPKVFTIADIIPKPPAVRRPEFSIITCSVNSHKFAQMESVYQQVMQGEDFEIIRISDATGLAEGYRRGARAARGRTLIFSHDDAAPVRPFAARLRSHLRQVDIVAGAGTDRLDGPAWFTAGPPHLFGQVLNNVPPGPQTPPFLLTVYGVPKRLVHGIQAFDGFWFAMNREVLGVVDFDPDLCDGFHMYDVDFSFRAYRRGIRAAVATDLFLMHASTGGYADPKWKPAADKWMARYGDLLADHRDIGFQMSGISGKDAATMITVMDQFVARCD